MSLRSSPSGRRFNLQTVATTQIEAWQPMIGPTTVIELVPAHHQPGVYYVGNTLDRIVVAGGGTATRNFTWSAPLIGNQTFGVAGTSLTGTGLLSNPLSIYIPSSGTQPITLQCSATNPSGNPLVDVYGIAQLVGPFSEPILNAFKTSPSGVVESLPQEVALAQTLLGFEPAIATVRFTLLEAGHEPGLYLVSGPITRRALATAGSINRIVNFDAPLFGATSLTNAAVLTGQIGPVGNAATATIISTGLAPITVDWTPVGVSGGPPIIDLYNAIQYVGQA